MKTKLAMLAILMMAMSSPALARGHNWGNWNWKSWGSNWSQKDNNCDWDWQKDCDWDWVKDCEYDWYNDCDWEYNNDNCRWTCKPKTPECEPPTGVPSPTAAIAGLGVMGMMLSRRRNKKA